MKTEIVEPRDIEGNIRRIVVVDGDEHVRLKDVYFKLDRFTRGVLMGTAKSTWADVDMIV